MPARITAPRPVLPLGVPTLALADTPTTPMTGRGLRSMPPRDNERGPWPMATGALPVTIVATHHTVDLAGQLSNPCFALQRMLDGKKSQVRRTSAGSVPSPSKQWQVRLSDTQRAGLVL